MVLTCIHAAGPISVSDLAAATGVNDTTVSQTLRYLRVAAIVSAERDGRVIRYRLADPAVAALLRHHEVSEPGLPRQPGHPAPARLSARRAGRLRSCAACSRAYPYRSANRATSAEPGIQLHQVIGQRRTGFRVAQQPPPPQRPADVHRRQH
ncbi:MAG: helix-turn-helix transcriptional regulator [Streptosporangiaceae bacterium]|nr:helix-turn-helix transcriptional regulator [Streptosporangiaceae bacterium]